MYEKERISTFEFLFYTALILTSLSLAESGIRYVYDNYIAPDCCNGLESLVLENK